MRKYSIDIAPLHQRWGTATKEDGSDRDSIGKFRRGAIYLQDCAIYILGRYLTFTESTLAKFSRRISIEVAVATALYTVWNMDVEREPLAHDYFFAFTFSLSAFVESAAMKASWGTSTLPTIFIRFLPSFCFSRSLRLRVISPP